MAGWVYPQGKNVGIPALSNSKERLHTDTTVSQTCHDLLWGQSGLPVVIMIKSSKASDIQALESGKFITNSNQSFSN